MIATINGQEFMLSELKAKISRALLRRFGTKSEESDREVTDILGTTAPTIIVEDFSDRKLIKAAKEFEKEIHEFYFE